MSESHGDAFTATSVLPGLNASLLYVTAHLDDVISPSIDQLAARLNLANQQLTQCEENVENIAATRNASRDLLTSQSPTFLVAFIHHSPRAISCNAARGAMQPRRCFEKFPTPFDVSINTLYVR